MSNKGKSKLGVSLFNIISQAINIYRAKKLSKDGD